MILRLLVLRDSLLSWPSANIHSSAFEVVLFVFVSSKRELLACLLCPSHALREEKSGARTKQHRVNMAGAPGGPYSGTSTLALVSIPSSSFSPFLPSFLPSFHVCRYQGCFVARSKINVLRFFWETQYLNFSCLFKSSMAYGVLSLANYSSSAFVRLCIRVFSSLFFSSMYGLL
jgi:hypothetical protein